MKHIEAFRRDNAIVDFLSKHKGRDNMVSSDEISEYLNQNGFKTKSSYIHQLIRKIVLERCLPICHVNTNGYFWAASKLEIQLSIDDLRGRIYQMQKRIELLENFMFN